MRKAEERIRKRREKILGMLPSDLSKGKTSEEIANKTDYSVATIRTDLGMLRTKGHVGCDDSRVPFKWYKISKVILLQKRPKEQTESAGHAGTPDRSRGSSDE